LGFEMGESVKPASSTARQIGLTEI
jgi:hypothetical protein